MGQYICRPLAVRERRRLGALAPLGPALASPRATTLAEDISTVPSTPPTWWYADAWWAAYGLPEEASARTAPANDRQPRENLARLLPRPPSSRGHCAPVPPDHHNSPLLRL